MRTDRNPWSRSSSTARPTTSRAEAAPALGVAAEEVQAQPTPVAATVARAELVTLRATAAVDEVDGAAEAAVVVSGDGDGAV